MAQLNFPDPNSVQVYEAGGLKWTWNDTHKVWSAEMVSDSYLSSTEDDTAAGAITFQGQTTHEAGVEVSGGDTSFRGLSAGSSGSVNLTTDPNEEQGTINFQIQGRTAATVNTLGRFDSKLDTKPDTATLIGFQTTGTLDGDGSSPVTSIQSYRSDGSVTNAFGDTGIPGSTINGYGFYATNNFGKSSASDANRSANRLLSYTAFGVRNAEDGAKTTYAFFSNLSASSNTTQWGFYSNGNASNFFRGKVIIGENSLNSLENDAATNSGIFLTTNITNNATAPLRIKAINQTSGIKRVYQTFTSSTSSDGAGSSVISRIQSTGSAGIRIINNDGTDPLTLFTTASTVTNPQDISFNASALVKLLQPKTFEIGGTNKVGFLAEDLKIAAPMTAEDDDEDGASYSPSSLIPILTKALQEALARIETLEAQVGGTN